MNLFFYGIFKKGFGANEWMESEGGIHIRPAKTKPLYKLYERGCALLVKSQNGIRIEGNLYRISSAKLLAELDRIEARYLRRPIEIEDFDEPCQAYFYYLPEHLLLKKPDVIDSGYSWRPDYDPLVKNS